MVEDPPYFINVASTESSAADAAMHVRLANCYTQQTNTHDPHVSNISTNETRPVVE